MTHDQRDVTAVNRMVAGSSPAPGARKKTPSSLGVFVLKAGEVGDWRLSASGGLAFARQVRRQRATQIAASAEAT